MKPLLCILALVLLSVSLGAQDVKYLSYTVEYDAPGWSADKIFLRLKDWYLEDYHFRVEHFGNTDYDYEGSGDNVFHFSGDIRNMKFTKCILGPFYSVRYDIFVLCSDGHMLVDLSNIKAYNGGWEIWNYLKYDYMTQGPEGVRRDFLSWYWAPSDDRKIRTWLESWFAEVSEIIYQAVASSDPGEYPKPSWFEQTYGKDFLK